MLSFDWLPWSLLTLFTVTTLEGWHEVADVIRGGAGGFILEGVGNNDGGK